MMEQHLSFECEQIKDSFFICSTISMYLYKTHKKMDWNLEVLQMPCLKLNYISTKFGVQNLCC